MSGKLGRNFSPDTVLIYVGLDLVGDALMKLPFVRALRNAYPRARITWAAGVGPSEFARQLAPLVDGLLDEVIETAGFDRPWSRMLDRPLGGRKFDLVIDTQRGLAPAMLLRRVRHEIFASGAAGFLLSDLRPARGWVRPEGLARYMIALLELVTGRPAAIDARTPLDPSYRAEAERLLPPGPTYVGLGAAAGGKHKLWPLDNYVELARHLLGRGLTPVFILGPLEADLVAPLSERVPEACFPSSKAHPAPGYSDSVIQTIAVAERLAAAVANDSGTGHMIAAAGTPLITLFGPTPAEKFAPLVANHVAISSRSFGGEAMDAIPVDVVDQKLDELLGRVRS